MVKRPRAGSASKGSKSHASEIAPGVFVGGWGDAESFEGTRICVLDEAPDEPMPADAHLPIYDGATDGPIQGNLEKVARLAVDARSRGEPVLLFCGHGIRRGALAGAWYLHVSERIPLREAFDRVQKVRPRIERPRQWMGRPGELLGAA